MWGAARRRGACRQATAWLLQRMETSDGRRVPRSAPAGPRAVSPSPCTQRRGDSTRSTVRRWRGHGRACRWSSSTCYGRPSTTPSGSVRCSERRRAWEDVQGLKRPQGVTRGVPHLPPSPAPRRRPLYLSLPLCSPPFPFSWSVMVNHQRFPVGSFALAMAHAHHFFSSPAGNAIAAFVAVLWC
ncbi:hypothetical protein PVAP13_2NG084238 [Panicum virgatum]|uniref:Uncharacterized protein n=1 Tax=Panicum virgatum TaxID=38727 RepID=A0A8T0VHG8_PANVG|nr:hypothetical protein PVAP13_2NG084238 [Panicum virgatum]